LQCFEVRLRPSFASVVTAANIYDAVLIIRLGPFALFSIEVNAAKKRFPYYFLQFSQQLLGILRIGLASIPIGRGGHVHPIFTLGACLRMSPQYLGVFVLETSIFSRHLIARSPSVCSNKQRLTAAAAYFLSEKL